MSKTERTGRIMIEEMIKMIKMIRTVNKTQLTRPLPVKPDIIPEREPNKPMGPLRDKPDRREPLKPQKPVIVPEPKA